MSRLAYWQSEALSRDLAAARAGSQSQLNARKLVSCPSLLAAALVSDPAIVLEPIMKPPSKSEVFEWLKSDGQPIDSKHAPSSMYADHRSAAADLPAVDYGQPGISKLSTIMSTTSAEIASTGVTDSESRHHQTLRSEKQSFGMGQQGETNNNDYADDDNKVGKKNGTKISFQKRQCRVSFLTGAEVNSAEFVTDEKLNFGDGKPATDKKFLPAAAAAAAAADDDDDDDDDDDGGGGSQQFTHGKSSMSDSSSILLCSQPSSDGQRLPKASFIELEVPASWRPRRQSQVTDCSPQNSDLPLVSRHSGLPPGSTSSSLSSGERHVARMLTMQSWRGHQASHVSYSSPQHFGLPPVFTSTLSATQPPHVASTPTMNVVRSRQQDDELVDLSVISCSPITPRTTSDQVMRTRSDEHRTHSFSVDGDQKEDRANDDDVVVIPCSPSTPTPTSPQPGCMKDPRTDNEDDEDDDDDVTVIPCTPVSATSSQPLKTSFVDERLSTIGVGDRRDHEVVDDEKVAVVSCVPVTPTTTTTVSNQAAHNKRLRISQRAHHPKVVHSVSFYTMINKLFVAC